MQMLASLIGTAPHASRPLRHEELKLGENSERTQFVAPLPHYWDLIHSLDWIGPRCIVSAAQIDFVDWLAKRTDGVVHPHPHPHRVVLVYCITSQHGLVLVAPSHHRIVAYVATTSQLRPRPPIVRQIAAVVVVVVVIIRARSDLRM
eukprot:scaffold252498_cov28-Attheya_sp.AAC.1